MYKISTNKTIRSNKEDLSDEKDSQTKSEKDDHSKPFK
jgi:hypothetical protein